MITNKFRLFIVPRWSGRVDSQWYPWLKRELEALDPPNFEQVTILDMPNPDLPVPEKWIPRIAVEVGTDPEELERTILVAHSIGCQACLRYLAALPPDRRILGLVCVAGFWSVDDPWDTLKPWLDEPMDHQRVKSSTERMITLLSPDDPITSDTGGNALMWETLLDAVVQIIPGSHHFMETAEPSVLKAIKDYFL
jgi:uncharacterized protein